jgi:hypothetical protein
MDLPPQGLWRDGLRMDANKSDANARTLVKLRSACPGEAAPRRLSVFGGEIFVVRQRPDEALGMALKKRLALKVRQKGGGFGVPAGQSPGGYLVSDPKPNPPSALDVF